MAVSLCYYAVHCNAKEQQKRFANFPSSDRLALVWFGGLLEFQLYWFAIFHMMIVVG